MSRFTKSLLCYAAVQLAFVSNVCASDIDQDIDSSPLGFLTAVFDESTQDQNSLETNLQINALEAIHSVLGQMKIFELQSQCDLHTWADYTNADEQFNALHQSYNRITKMSGLSLTEDLSNLDDALENLYAKMMELNTPQDVIDTNKGNLQLALQIQGLQNLQHGTDQIYTARNALITLQKNLNRMKVLTVKSTSETIGAIDRGMIQAEFGSLLSNVDIISTQTRFNYVPLFTGGAGKAIVDHKNGISLTPSAQTKTGDWTLSYDADDSIYTLTNGLESYSEYYDDIVTFRNGVTITALDGIDRQESIPETVYTFTNGKGLKSRIYYTSNDKISLKFTPFSSEILGLTGCAVNTCENATTTSYALNTAIDDVSLEIAKLSGLETQLRDLTLYLASSSLYLALSTQN